MRIVSRSRIRLLLANAIRPLSRRSHLHSVPVQLDFRPKSDSVQYRQRLRLELAANLLMKPFFQRRCLRRQQLPILSRRLRP